MNTLFHNEEAQQINFLDNRYYTLDNKVYYPSVTTILEVYPKGFGFDQWLKDVGSNATQIADRAAIQGTIVHDATEKLNEGVEILWDEDIHSLNIWKMILRYQKFWEQCSPELIANEERYCSSKLGFGGTMDRVVKMHGSIWLIDIKTSNYLHASYWMQLTAYAQMWNQFNKDQQIEKIGILWLKSSVRTDKIDPDKDIYQGKGWQLKSPDKPIEHYWKLFQHTHAIWKEENPNYKPLNQVYPDRIKL